MSGFEPPGAASAPDPAVAADSAAITALVLRERQGRDRRWWDQMAACYLPDAPVRLTWYQGDAAGFVEGSRRMSQRSGWQATHRLGPVLVRVQGQRALAEVPAAIEIRDDLEGVAVDLTVYTRLLYRVQRTPQGWLLASLDCVYERDTLAPVLPGQAVPLDPDRLARFRPAYRFLSYVNAAAGRVPDQDQYGEDRPDGVGELYRELFTWLSTSSA